MAWTGSGTLSASVPSLGYFSLPFLFTNFDHAIRAMEKLRPSVSAVIRDKMGAEMLAWGPNGFRVIVTKGRAIRSAADMKGLKMRVPEIPLYVNTFRLLQTNATPLPWGELYTAMQTGIVDGLEGPSGAIETSKFQEVATDLSRTNHILTDFTLLANRKKLESLSKEHQAIVREEAVKLDQRFQAMSRTFDDAAYDKLKAKLKSVENLDLRELPQSRAAGLGQLPEGQSGREGLDRDDRRHEVMALPAGRRLQAGRRRLIRVIEACVLVLFLTFTLTTLIAVFNRFVMNYSLVEGEELIRYSLVWMTMLAASLVTDEGGHLNGSFMGFIRHPLARRIEAVAIHAGIGVFGLLLAASAWQLIGQSIETSPALGVNMGVAYAAMFVGGVLELVMVVLIAFDPSPPPQKVEYAE